MVQQSKLYINGQWIEGRGAVFTSLDPSNERVVWKGAEPDSSQIETVYSSSLNAFQLWRKEPLNSRISVIKAFKTELEDSKEQLSDLISIETGKPKWETLQEVSAMCSKVDISIEAYHDKNKIVEFEQAEKKIRTSYKPHGPLLVFGPYNFPGHLPNGHIVPALIAGNTIIFKPSELTPAVGEYIVNLWGKAELPKGVLQLVQGGKNLAQKLLTDTRYRGLLFTGSSKTGQILASHFSNDSSRLLALEMGGNNPLILSDSNDLAIPILIQSAFMSAGQRCTCLRRLIVVKSSKNKELVSNFIDSSSSLKINSWNTTPSPFYGPLISAQARDLVLEEYHRRVALGGKVLLPMRRVHDNGYFLSPGIIDVTSVSGIADEEHFGPLVSLYWVNSLEEGIELANNTSYGLSASLLSSSKEEYDLFYRSIDAGIINWNVPTNGASSKAPFGGVKGSGNHRASAYFAADYCSYPVASVTSEHCLKSPPLPGVTDVS
jgi:succinylglutamic semialdehyde dehydrogenase